MKSLFCVLLLSLPFLPSDWELKKDKNDIQVFTKAVEGSKLKAIKAKTIVNAPLNTCVAVLRDIDHLNELFPDCERAVKIEKTEVHQIHYLELNAPWPVTDRDGAFKLIYSYDPVEGAVNIKAETVPDAVPEKDGFVRLKKGVGTWKFKRLDANRTEVHYFYHGDPGGNIPEWLANSVVEESPYNMFLNFHKLVKLERYQGKTFSFIK